MATNRIYFAAESRKNIGVKLMQRLEQYAKNDLGRGAQYATAYSHYYGQEAGAGITMGVTRKGEQGELAAVRVNRARRLSRALHALVTGPKVSWRPQARNGDAGAAKATSLASGLLEDEWRTKGMLWVWLRWLEQALAFADAFVFAEWNRAIGPPLAARNGRLILQGDAALHNVLPWNHFCDTSRDSYEELDCHFVRLRKNRFDMAKLCRRLVDGRSGDEAEAAILSATEPEALGGIKHAEDAGADSSDDIASAYFFFHKPTPSLPMGRRTVLLSEGVVLEDGPLRPFYDEVPLYRLAAAEMFGTPRGWTPFWDSLGVQEILDGIETTLSTIVTTLGVPTIGVEKGTENAPELLGNGLRTWTHPPGTKPPTAVQLAQFPSEALKYRSELAADQQQDFGLNDVALGQPQGAQMNAQAFAVLASMAVQQASPLQSAATAALGRLGTGYLKTLRQHVSRTRILKVTGTSSKHLYSEKRWSGMDLKPLDAVTVDVGNPLEQTAAGRTMLLEKYMTIPGVITSPEQITQVAETGRLEPATRGVRDELQLIQSEYEALQTGEVPPVHTFDNHLLHYRENGAVLHNADARSDRAVVDAVQAHCDMHYLEQFGIPPDQDPLRLPRQRFLLGQGPEPMPMPPPGPPMPGDVPPGPPDEAPPPPALAQPPAQGLENVPPPQMPPNPMTGGEFVPGAPPVAA